MSILLLPRQFMEDTGMEGLHSLEVGPPSIHMDRPLPSVEGAASYPSCFLLQ